MHFYSVEDGDKVLRQSLDHIGIFVKVFATIFLSKVAQIFSNSLGFF